MPGPAANRIRKSFRSRLIRGSLAFSCLVSVGSLVTVVAGFPLIAIYVVAVAVLTLATSICVIQYSFLVGELDDEKRERKAFAELARLITRAEWRSGQSSGEIMGQVRKNSVVNEVEVLARQLSNLEHAVENTHKLRRGSAQEPRCAGNVLEYSKIEERDLENLLTHLLVSSARKEQ